MAIIEPFHFRLKNILVAFVCLFILASCGDDGADGADGVDGSNGNDGSNGISAPSPIPDKFSGNFTLATVASDGTLTVDFLLMNESGDAFIGLSPSNINFTINQLFPEDSSGQGDASYWQSYINKIELAPTDPVNGPGTEDKVQATSEKDGALTDNGDGSYRYVFNTNISKVTSPIEVTYNADNTHRVAIQISGGEYPTFNQTYSWQPSSGSTDNIANRDIVIEGSCNNCHGELAMHGGGRTNTQYCVTCHNPGTSDANSGNILDFKVMVHKIHRGIDLHEVVGGGEYAIWGYKDTKHDYSGSVFPQDIRNCSNCHDEAIAETPEAMNWYTRPAKEACTSCHDNLDFTIAGTEPNGHPGGPQADNSLCANCHGPNGGFPVKDMHEGALVNQQVGVNKLVFTIDSAALDVGKNLTVGLTMMLDEQPVLDFADIEPFIGGPGGELMINYDDGTGYQFTYSSPGTGFVTTNGMHLKDCTNNGLGKFTCIRNDIAGASFGDTGTIALTFFEMPLCVNEKASNGALVDCSTVDGGGVKVAQVAMNVPRKFFNIDGSEAVDYVEKVAADKESCNGCHQSLSVHNVKDSAIDYHAAIDFNQCTSCHNATRISFYGGRPGDLKSHVHSFHAGADSTSDHNIGSPYPDDISNCNACHSEGQFDLPLKMNSRASAAPSGGDPVFISATAVVCSSCHIKVPAGYIDPAQPGYSNSPDVVISAEDQSLITHMVTNGAVFASPNFEDANIVEACAVCHGPGKSVALEKVHNIR